MNIHFSISSLLLFFLCFSESFMWYIPCSPTPVLPTPILSTSILPTTEKVVFNTTYSLLRKCGFSGLPSSWQSAIYIVVHKGLVDFLRQRRQLKQ